jgi:hypothetical protein
MICFYHNHYYTIVKSEEGDIWTRYDDGFVHVVDGGWQKVMENLVEA